ncbi:helix-turn-helix transcriptional regulator [Fusibacter sp. 3D3]|uniref:helix-turn-helix transcriptional regulator n=1 Tax=Fusibacter sp. 3D3 TaxID=1048380 RepID=UPI0008539335|nr:PAS domain S-box protein [Fusibacter sp. 3D3]GAU79181.1 transcriptional regulator [Fusibacter sp. 3D3]
MINEKNSSIRIQYRRADDLLPDRFLRLSVPGTLSRLREINQELAEELSSFRLQNDELEQARTDLELLLLQYSTLYDSAPVGYLTLNRSGIILQVNSACVGLFGVEKSNLINEHFQQFMSSESWSEYTSFLKNVHKKQSQEIFEFELQRTEDTIIVHMEVREDKKGNTFIAALIDVTEEVQAKTLRKEEHIYRTIYENITHGIVICDRDGKIVSANQSAESILGLTFNQMDKKPLDEFFSDPIHEDGKAFTKKPLPFMKELNSSGEQNLTMGYKPPDSTHYTWIVVSAISVSMPDEDEVRYVISFDNITAQKNLVLYNKLTSREKQVFQKLVTGHGRTEIADSLDISKKTVDKHKENLMEKLNIYSPDELVDYSKKL